jgi:hypothetical protein
MATEDVRLAEFVALRTEIQERSSRQHTLIGLALTATAFVGGAVLARHAKPAALLVLPAITIPLGLLWLGHALTIDRLASYIREELWIWTPSWEKHISGPAPVWHTTDFMLPVLMVFAGPAIVALAASASQLHTPRWALWVGGAIITVAFVLRTYGFTSKRRGNPLTRPGGGPGSS